MGAIWLAEITVYDPAISGTRVLRFASGAGYNHPTAPGYYEPRIIQAANFRRDMFEPGATAGPSRTGYGALELANPDGALDGFLEYGFAGFGCRILVGGDRDPYSTFAIVLVGSQEQPVFTWSTMQIRLRDRQFELDRPIQANRYAGTNALPAGLEGVAGDLKGLPKVQAWGAPRNVAPPMVNTSRLILQLNDGAIADAPAGYDGGRSLTKGAAYTSQADMETTAPAPGNYRVWPAGGYARLGSSPVGVITFDVQQGATAADRSAAQIWKSILTSRGGIASGDVSADDVAALDAANNAPLGIWIAGEINTAPVLDLVAGSVGAFWGPDRLGQFRIRRFEAPAGVPVITFRRFAPGVAAAAGDGDIVSIERKASADDGRGVPAKKIVLRYRRNWTRQEVDIDAAVTPARREELRQEWATVEADAAEVLPKYPNAPQIEFETYIDDPTAAQAEADRRRELYKVRRDRLRLVAKIFPGSIASLDLGTVVRLVLPRFGLNAGKLFVITGLQYDAKNFLLDMDLWG